MNWNPEEWPQLIYDFGPYGLLVLMVMIIIWAHKRIPGISDSVPTWKKITAMLAVGMSWSIFALLAGYIVINWPPTKVYEGQLGMLNYSEKICPLDSNLYVKAEGIHGTDKERWSFALVDKGKNENKESGTADFIYFWGKSDNEYTEYMIPIDNIVQGEVKEFDFTMREAEKAYRWEKDQWVVALGPCDDQQPFNLSLTGEAFADEVEDLELLKEKLASSNRLVRAKARKELRILSNEDLQSLKTETEEQKALHQIQLEQERR